MLPYKANLLNGLVLFIVGLLSYFSAYNNVTIEINPTMFIAPTFGLLFVILTPGMKKDNKVVAQLVVLLTFLLGSMLLILFIKQLSMGSNLGSSFMMRLLIMIFSCFTAMVVFVGSIKK